MVTANAYQILLMESLTFASCVLTRLVRQLDEKEFEVGLVPHWTHKFLIRFQFPQFLCDSGAGHVAASWFVFVLLGEDASMKYQISKVLLVYMDAKEKI